MANEDYSSLVALKGADYIIDDHNHTPAIFIQFHDVKWLYERLNGIVPNSWPLYLWIYSNCIYVKDPNNIYGIVDQYKQKFRNELSELIKGHHIVFSVRRLDTCSSSYRGLFTAAKINCAEMVKAALQVLCLIKEEPFAYNKWLAKEVELLYKDERDLEILDVCNKCLAETDLVHLAEYSKELRDKMEILLMENIGDRRWIHYWWEFNKN